MAAKATQAAKAMAGKAVKTAQTAQAAQAARATRATAKAAPSGPADYDAIVVGGGHNGLVAAAYLARSGARTLVLEARPKTGGAATTEAPWPDAPDFKVTRLSYVMSLLPPTIINDLQLERHGYKIYPMGPYYQAFPEGGSIKLYADDAIDRERPLDLRRLEPVVEQIGDRHRHQPGHVGDRADVKAAVAPGQPERLLQVPGLTGAEVRRHGEQQRAQYVG